MRVIQLREDTPIKSSVLLGTVLGTSPTNSITVDEIRKRVRILDLVENSTDGTLVLEDSDYAFLNRLIQSFPFSVANKDLLSIIDTITEAKVQI